MSDRTERNRIANIRLAAVPLQLPPGVIPDPEFAGPQWDKTYGIKMFIPQARFIDFAKLEGNDLQRALDAFAEACAQSGRAQLQADIDRWKNSRAAYLAAEERKRRGLG